MKQFYKFINTGSLNIQGLYKKINSSYIKKLKDTEFLDTGKNLDIFCLSEIHIGKDSELETHIPNYKFIKSCHTISGDKRYFGDLCSYIHKSIKEGVVLIKKIDHSDIIWIKLLKEFFKFGKDLFIGFVYV